MSLGSANQVIVYTVNPRQLNEPVLKARYGSALDEREQTTYTTLPTAELKHNFLSAHVLVRTALGQMLGTEPKSLRFRQRRFGKPVLSVPHAGVHFNVSHTTEMAAVAISQVGPVGMDVEDIRRLVDWQGIANLFLAGPALHQFHSTVPAERPVAFFRQWVMREALLKSAGVGIPALDRARIRALQVDDGAQVGQHFVRMLPLMGQIVGAVAVRNHCEPVNVRVEDGLALFEAGVAIVD